MLRRRVCGASHNTVDSITGENASGCGTVMWVLGGTVAGLPGELTVTEAKQGARAYNSPLSARQNPICSRCYRGIPQCGGGEAVVQ